MFAKEVFDMVEELTDAFRRLTLDDKITSQVKQHLPSLPTSATPTAKGITNSMSSGEHTKGIEGLKLHCASVLRDPTPPPAMGIEQRAACHTATFGQLPSDILYHLLLLARTSDPDESLRMTVKLSHVCSHWRNVAIGAPLLWTYVWLSWSSRQQRHLFTVEKLLHRSQQLPLTLRFVVNGVEGIEYISYWLKVLYNHTQRIRTLILTLPPLTDYDSAVRMIVSPLKMPSLARFYLEMTDFNRMHCSVSLKPREQVDGNQCSPAMPRYRRTPYLDWTARPFHITSLSLKSVLVMARDLFPILVMSQSTLVQLEYYVSNCHPDWEDEMPRINLPKLTTLRIGYGCVNPAYLLVRRLALPSLSSVTVHDFRRCPETGLPTLVPAKITPDRTDALVLLRALQPFTSITNLTLRGVECFTSSLREVEIPLQPLIHGLKSLVLVNCDAQFLHILYNTTVETSRQSLVGLSELAITCHNYSMVLDYLRLREARGLPRLKTLSVNSKMAILRPIVRDFVDTFHVRGSANQQHREETLIFYPYVRAPRPKQNPTVIRGLRPHQDLVVPSL
ncbi:hypothetical protein H0H87_011633 [Tephrocybe sp. NHM501043]|nr:hypothetical protein H0H87_011633 [Tephrocybe sp. NHM501043]